VRFKNCFKLDFYADLPASILLRKVFMQTEKITEEDKKMLE